MLNKDRLQHPERYEVTVYDTATEKIIAEHFTFGYILGEVREVGIVVDDEVQTHYSVRPSGANICAHDVATLVVTLLDMYPEAEEILKQMASGDFTFTEIVRLDEEGEDVQIVLEESEDQNDEDEDEWSD